MSVWHAGYRRWQGASTGVWTRRLAIARYGLRLCLRGKIVRAFLFLGLLQGLVIAGAFFVFGQLVATDSAIIRFIESVGGLRMRTLVNGLSSWALLYPEICVDGVFRLLFSQLRYTNLLLSLVTVALYAHRLIANDMASQAIVIYNSKALTTWDYLLGKFAIAATALSLIWIAPVLIAWLLGNLLSPDWSFAYHSLPSLLRGLALGAVAVVSLSSLALAVSSLARRTSAAISYWVIGWLALDMAAGAASQAIPALRLLSPARCIEELSRGLFRLDLLLADARSALPFFESTFREVVERSAESVPAAPASVAQPLLALCAFTVAGLWLAGKRARVAL